MVLKLHSQKEPKDTTCPAFALGCDNCTPISVLKPEIVIEERRWFPYPLVIRHYIPKQRSKRDNCFQRIYCKCKDELAEWEKRRKDRQRAKEAAERIERERCLKELRRLHSYHQKLCCHTQSFTSFSKQVKKIKSSKSKFGFLPRSRHDEKKTKLKERLKPTVRKKEKNKESALFMCLRLISNIGCFICMIALLGVALFVLT